LFSLDLGQIGSDRLNLFLNGALSGKLASRGIFERLSSTHTMSHKKRRIEKVCLNCGHEVEERFCSKCGQENLELNDSVTHLIIHYFQDLFHYDGKLWHTLKYLLTRPGQVAKDYMDGKRQSHLEPIRFYVFASTVFFLFFFFVVGDEPYTSGVTPETNYSKRLYNLNQEKLFLAGSADTVPVNQLIQSVQRQSGDTLSQGVDSIIKDVKVQLLVDEQDTLSSQGWLADLIEERFEARAAELEAKHEGDEDKATGKIVNEIVHAMPQLFFLSLPFFALFLKLLYWRSRRTKYVEHFIFSIYHYAYLFVIMFFYIVMAWMMDSADGSMIDRIDDWLTLIFVLYPFVYLFLSMKRFYDDQWTKLFIRYIALSLLLLFIIMVLFLFLVILTFLF